MKTLALFLSCVLVLSFGAWTWACDGCEDSTGESAGGGVLWDDSELLQSPGSCTVSGEGCFAEGCPFSDEIILENTGSSSVYYEHTTAPLGAARIEVEAGEAESITVAIEVGCKEEQGWDVFDTASGGTPIAFYRMKCSECKKL